MFWLRSSTRLLRKLCESSRSHGRCEVQGVLPPRWLSGATSAARDTSLLRPLHGRPRPARPPPHPYHLAPQRRPRRLRGPPGAFGVLRGVRSFRLDSRTCWSLEKLAFKDTAHRSHLQIVQDVEATGGSVGASVSREQMVYGYDALKAYLPQAVEVLLDCVLSPPFLQDEVERQLALAREEVQELHKNPDGTGSSDVTSG